MTKGWLFETVGRILGGSSSFNRAAMVTIMPGIERNITKNWQAALGLPVDVIGKNAGANVGLILSIHRNF